MHLLEVTANCISELGMIVLDCENLVTFIVENLLRDFLLRADGVNGHDELLMSMKSNYLGIAVISLDLESTSVCPRGIPCSVTQAEAMF